MGFIGRCIKMKTRETNIPLAPKVAKTAAEIRELKKLSTEKLIIWIVGRSQELGVRLTLEELVLECWLINPEKHSLRGYPQFPDSRAVLRRAGEMHGKKGLLTGKEVSGYLLTELSRRQYADLRQLVSVHKVPIARGTNAADRTISASDEAPYKRLKKTPAYEKLARGREQEIVETDFLYFYGVNWHTKRSVAHNRIKNVDAVVQEFEPRDPLLGRTRQLLNDRFSHVRKHLLESNGN
jgi:hypothetical protein